MVDYIFDIDGTLADCEHRRHYIRTKPKNYRAFYQACWQDSVIEPVAMIARKLLSTGSRVICCSGRPEWVRDLTETWLVRYARIGFHRLYMRPDNDYRPDDVVKEELLDRILADGFDPKIAFDDRSRVVSMWRRRGIICAQVAEGNF